MKKFETKMLIVGVIAIFIVSSLSPAYSSNKEQYEISTLSAKIKTLEALGEGPQLQIGLPSRDVYELEDVTFTVTINSNGDNENVDGASVYFEGALLIKNKQTEDGVVTFTAEEIEGNNDYSTFTVTAEKSGYTSDETEINVYNRYLKITTINPNPVNENKKYFVKLKDQYDTPVSGSIEFNGGTHIILATGSYVPCCHLPEDENGDVGEDKTFKIYAHRAFYKRSNDKYVTVHNVNCNPGNPCKPSGDRTPDLGFGYNYQVSCSDPDGSKVSYGWDWNGDFSVDEWDDNGGLFYESGQTCISYHTWHNKGLKIIRVKAKDTHGSTSGWSKGLKIWVNNEAPNVPSLDAPEYIDAPAGGQGTGVFKAEATDPDTHMVKYLFSWENGEHPTELVPSGQEVSVNLNFDAGKVYHVSVKAIDEYGKESKSSCCAKVVVGNIAPYQPNKPSKVKRGNTYDFTTSGADENSDNLEYLFDWGDRDDSGWFGPYGSGDTVKASHEYNSAGFYTVKVKSRDLDSNGNPKGTESPWSDGKTVVVVRGDSGMTMTVGIEDGNSPNYTVDMVPKTYIDSDTGERVDRDSEGYSLNANMDGSYDILQNGERVVSGLTSSDNVKNYFSNNMIPDGGSEDNDDSGGGSDDSNGAPSISSISDKTVNEGSSLTFTIYATDPDGDDLTFSKTNGPGSVTANSNTQPNNYCGFADGGQTDTTQSAVYTYYASHDDDSDDEENIYVEIKVSDGKGGTDTEYFYIDVIDDDEDDESETQPLGFDIMSSNEETISDPVPSSGVTLQFDSSGTQLPAGVIENNTLADPNQKQEVSISSDEKQFSIINDLSSISILDFIKNFIDKLLNLDSLKVNNDITSIDGEKDPSSSYEDTTEVDDSSDVDVEASEENNEFQECDPEPIEGLKYVWNFGDGNIAVGKNPEHTYSLSSDMQIDDTKDMTTGEFVRYAIGIDEDSTSDPLVNDGSTIDDANSDDSSASSISNEDDSLIPDSPINGGFIPGGMYYTVTLYIVIDEEDVLKDVKHVEDLIDLDLSSVEILDKDATTVSFSEPLIYEGDPVPLPETNPTDSEVTEGNVEGSTTTEGSIDNTLLLSF